MLQPYMLFISTVGYHFEQLFHRIEAKTGFFHEFLQNFNFLISIFIQFNVNQTSSYLHKFIHLCYSLFVPSISFIAQVFLSDIYWYIFDRGFNSMKHICRIITNCMISYEFVIITNITMLYHCFLFVSFKYKILVLQKWCFLFRRL